MASVAGSHAHCEKDVQATLQQHRASSGGKIGGNSPSKKPSSSLPID